MAFSPPTPVLGYTTIASATYLGVWFVDVTAVRALFVRVTDGFDAEAPSLQVVVVALISEEFSVVQSAGRGRSGELTVRQGSFGQSTATGGAPFTLAGMISHIFVIETLIAFIAKVRFVKESAVGIASVVVLTLFDETNDFV